jgi:hypothetical protein
MKMRGVYALSLQAVRVVGAGVVDGIEVGDDELQPGNVVL